ncbi:MAG TPA: two-component regulator propeller domain-containing protein, partial [Verrucomicrobiae bacterium]|nr:two-component regulator propeller domain-containing protein [Verrucomicrobiae bacterium]
MKRRIQFLLICLAAALFLGQRAGAAESPFVVDVWSTADRLPENTVIALTQTHDGYLWVGTLNGLARFDGNSFTPFNVNNMPNLPGNGIVFLFEDSRTNLWVGTDNGSLSIVTRGTLKQVYAGGEGRGKFTAGFDDQTGTVWFVTDARQVFCWHDNALDQQPQVYGPLRDLLIYLAFHVAVANKDGGGWQFGSGNLEKVRGGAHNSLGLLPCPVATITAACEDEAGNLILGTSGAGVYWFDAAGKFRHITKEEGLSEDYVLSLCFDSEKNLWVGTDGGGLDRVRKNFFSAPPALAGNVAQSVAEDGKGGIWSAFNLGGLTYWITNSAQHFHVPLNAWCVLVDSRQQVWAGTSGAISSQPGFGRGLYRLVDGNFQPVPAALAAGQKIFSLCQTHDGKVWVGGDSGLGSFDGNEWRFYSLNDGLPKSAVRALAEDTNGVLWIGTESEGLYALREGNISAITASVKDISTLLSAADGSLWVGTYGHGLAHQAAGDGWKFFSSTLNGLVSDDIGSLVEDGEGNIWTGSYEGLVRVGKQSFADVVSGAAKTLSSRTFLTHEFSAGAQPSALRAHDGKLWFPTIEGVVAINPADLRLNTNPPPVIIESVLVDDVELKTNLLDSKWTSAITLTPENEQLEIHFTSLNFSAPK